MADEEESPAPAAEEEAADAPPAEAGPSEDEAPAPQEDDVPAAVAEELEAAAKVAISEDDVDQPTEGPPQEGEDAAEYGADEEGAVTEGEESEFDVGGVPDSEVAEEEGEGSLEKSTSAQKTVKRVSMAEVEAIDGIAEEDEDLMGGDEEAEDMGESPEDTEGKREKLFKKKQKILGSIISIRRGDGTYYDRQKVPKYQNSYKLESDKPFNPEKVQQILREVLEEALQDLVYDQDKVPKQAKWASSAIRAKVKEQEYDRYKIICFVSIGEKLCQDVQIILRFLWDAERDGFAQYVHETMNLFALGLCFGIYYE